MAKKYYTIYRTTNTITKQFYVGMHETDDPYDNYFGSGKRIRLAITKYGKDKFKKCVLHIFDTRKEMVAKEKEIVTEKFCLREDTYNINPGGEGGFGHINASGKNVHQKGMDNLLRGNKEFIQERGDWDSYIKKLSAGRTGDKNHQYGTRWVTNGKRTMKIRNGESLPDGFVYGIKRKK